MFTNSYNDNTVFCVLEGMLLAPVVMLAIQKGHDLATFLADSMNIPYNLSLSVISVGFGNEVVILSVVFATVLAVFIIEKAIPDLVRHIFWH